MRQRATPSEPEGMLMEFLADAFWFQRRFTAVERFQDGEGTPDQVSAGVHTAKPRQSFIREDCNEGMHTVVRLQFIAPATFRRCPAQPNCSYFANMHVVDPQCYVAYHCMYTDS